MSKYVIENTTLVGIADAVREKAGTSEPIVVSELAAAITAIPTGIDPVGEIAITSNGNYDVGDYATAAVNVPQDGAPTAEDLTFSGECNYRFAYGGWDWVIEKYGNQITTKDIINATKMFQGTYVDNIPFELNFDSGNPMYLDYMFGGASALKEIPKINNKPCPYDTSSMFFGCASLRNLPEDIADWFDWHNFDNASSAYGAKRGSNIFYGCYSLRSVPMEFLSHENKLISSYYNTMLQGIFQNCYCLDEIIGLPIPYETINGNMFGYAFDYCRRLKNLTFELDENNQPLVKKWKGQVIDLSKEVGYTTSTDYITNYNSGITNDKIIRNASQYEALKNDPDVTSAVLSCSRYNHDSAVNTINSLPDTSAYLATAGGTNTITFKGSSGNATDGGAISNLTAEEIAVATAKGWTVTLV